MKKSANLVSKFSQIKHIQGQSIIEIVLSIGISALVISALIVLGTLSLRTALSSARRDEATKLATSGIEALRFKRDSEGFSTLSDGCYLIDSTATPPIQEMTTSADPTCVSDTVGWDIIDLTNSTSKSIFERKILVRPYGTSAEQAKMKKVTTTVRWPESGGTQFGANTDKTVVLSVVLSEWK